jgi:hypothetical protein
MMYAKIQNNAPVEWPVHEFQIRSAMTNVSLPVRLTPEDVAGLGFEPYATSDKPEFDALVQDVQESTPIKQGSTWTQQWSVTEKYSAEEKATVLAEAETQKQQAQAVQVRAARNEKLAASDWTQLADSTADKAAWATHRQALRDITAQEGFPWTIDWPTQP